MEDLPTIVRWAVYVFAGSIIFSAVMTVLGFLALTVLGLFAGSRSDRRRRAKIRLRRTYTRRGQ